MKYIALIDYPENDPEAESDRDLIDVKYLKAKTLEEAHEEAAEFIEYYGCLEECYMDAEAENFPINKISIIEYFTIHKFNFKSWFNNKKEQIKKENEEYDKRESELKAKNLKEKEPERT